MSKKIVGLFVVCFSVLLFSGNGFADERFFTITKTVFANQDLPERDQEVFAMEDVEKAFKAAVISKITEQVVYIDGELTTFSPGVVSNWYLMQQYQDIFFDNKEKVARGTLEVPRDVFIEYLKENVSPLAIQFCILKECGREEIIPPSRTEKSPEELKRDTGMK